jgi:hypothetical protein
MVRITVNRQVGLVAGAAALSWLGEYIHNQIALPQLTLLSPANSLVALGAILLFLAWWLLPYKRLTITLLLAWGVLNLAWAIATILPTNFLPFSPEQTLEHYFAHVIYALAQMPLIVIMASGMRIKD